MRSGFARLAAGLVGGLLAGGALLSPLAAAEMRPEEAKRFIANKLFSYTCFDGTRGAGRIQADGSVIGTMQANGGRVRYRLGCRRLCADAGEHTAGTEGDRLLDHARAPER